MLAESAALYQSISGKYARRSGAGEIRHVRPIAATEEVDKQEERRQAEANAWRLQ